VKKLKKFIKKHKVALIVCICIILLIVSIPSAYFLGKNSNSDYDTSFNHKKQVMYSPLSSEPFERMEQLSRRMDRMFDEIWEDPFFSYSYEFPSIRDMDFLPSTNFQHYMTDDEIVIKADLPIEDENQVNVTITKDGVTMLSSASLAGTSGPSGNSNWPAAPLSTCSMA